VKNAMMHAQVKSEKESKEKDDGNNASQALQRFNKSETKREWMNLLVKKESLHNKGKQWASGTIKDDSVERNSATIYWNLLRILLSNVCSCYILHWLWFTSQGPITGS
jgi:hypothetical protein